MTVRCPFCDATVVDRGVVTDGIRYRRCAWCRLTWGRFEGNR